MGIMWRGANRVAADEGIFSPIVLLLWTGRTKFKIQLSGENISLRLLHCVIETEITIMVPVFVVSVIMLITCNTINNYLEFNAAPALLCCSIDLLLVSCVARFVWA